MIKIGSILLILANLATVQPAVFAQNVPARKKPLCNPLVLGQPPVKRLSLVADFQTRSQAPTHFNGHNQPAHYATGISNVASLRLGYTKNLVMKPRLYMSFTGGYWFSRFAINDPGNNDFANELDGRAFHSVSVSTNIFKPLNATNFLLVNLSVEASGNGSSFRRFGADNLLAGGAIIFGWKKGVKRMWGLGAFRGYRLGKVIHVPALLYNNSFNKKWGMDALFPARAALRYTASPKTMWSMGYDLEGTQYAMRSTIASMNDRFFQRGEIRPRIGLEKQLNKYWAFTANAGVRFNGRMEVSADYLGDKQVVRSEPNAALFVNAGFHVVNFAKRKKR